MSDTEPTTSAAAAAGPSTAKAKKPRHKHVKREAPASSSAEKQASSISNSTQPSSKARRLPAELEIPASLSKKAVPNTKLRTKLIAQHKQAAAARQAAQDYRDYLLPAEAGAIETEGDVERTWRVGQGEIKDAVAVGVARKGWAMKLEGGCAAMDWTPDGRTLALTSASGHIASLDPSLGKLHSEIWVNEYTPEIKFLHNNSMYAVAQKKYVYIYDSQGIELHRLKDHVEVRRMEFLRYHFLLATIGNAGWLKYQDTSTGQLVSQIRTKLGTPSALTQNPQTAVLSVGHQNGTVTLWTPSVPTPHVKLQAHLGPVRAVAHDHSGNYIATAGVDGRVKVWDVRRWEEVWGWGARGEVRDLEWSARGMLGVGWGNHVNVYNNLLTTSPTARTPSTGPAPYLTHHLPGRAVSRVRFCPYEDVLTVAHAHGIESMLVPGAGEPNYDALEVDPFEGRGARREREVRTLLDKIQPDLITYAPSSLGAVSVPRLNTNPNAKPLPGPPRPRSGPTPFGRLPRAERLALTGQSADAEGEDDDEPEGLLVGAGEGDGQRPGKEEKEKMKMRGKMKATKRFLRKKRKNVIEPSAIALKAKMAKMKEQREREAAERRGTVEAREPSALDRFTRKG